MKTENNKATDEAQIRERLESWAKAVRAKDIEGVMSNYAPDNLLFRPRATVTILGRKRLSKKLGRVVPDFPRPHGLRSQRVADQSSNDVAFCHSLNHMHGIRTGGEHTDVWGRLLVCASWTADG